MSSKKTVFLKFLLVGAFQSQLALDLIEQFKQGGYVEMCDQHHGSSTFDMLYAQFDELIEFLQMNPGWAQKLYHAKERFIRSHDRNYYSTDFFGFYDESHKEGRHQISFYYSRHFHSLLSSLYPAVCQIPEINRFLQSCYTIQKPYAGLFEQAAIEVGLPAIFLSKYNQPPILLKVIKYLPSYRASSPHYDGTAFSLFLDSTDNQSLLLCAYKTSYTINDFLCPARKFSREPNHNSILLIPGGLLAEFSLYPTPHIVVSRGITRYATIAFAMRPHHLHQKTEFSLLPLLNY